jgi:hypothetical protein
VPPGPFVAKADASTGEQIWRTYLENANASGRWLPAVNLNIMANGRIAFAWQNNVALLDPDTGLMLKRTTLPTGETPVSQSGFKHLTIAPDGTLILKNQTRPNGYDYQGTQAIVRGVMEGFEQPNSHLVAVDPDTLEVLDHLALPEPATVPHIVTMFEGKIAIYLGVNSGALRYFWDAATRKLSQDTSWVHQADAGRPVHRRCAQHPRRLDHSAVERYWQQNGRFERCRRPPERPCETGIEDSHGLILVHRLSRRAITVAATLGLCGCATVGPQSITAGRGIYNEVINRTEDEQILNALVRLRYDETFGMITVASVTANLKFKAHAVAAGGIRR